MFLFVTSVATGVYYCADRMSRGRILGRKLCQKSLRVESENSQDYAQKPQRNRTFVNSASGIPQTQW